MSSQPVNAQSTEKTQGNFFTNFVRSIKSKLSSSHAFSDSSKPQTPANPLDGRTAEAATANKTNIVKRTYNRLRGNLSQILGNYETAQIFFEKAGMTTSAIKMQNAAREKALGISLDGIEKSYLQKIPDEVDFTKHHDRNGTGHSIEGLEDFAKTVHANVVNH